MGPNLRRVARDGPVGIVIKFEDEDDVVRQASDSVYDLAAAVFTEDITRALKVAHRLKAETTWVNCANQLHVQIPLGGYKTSCIGRELSTLTSIFVHSLPLLLHHHAPLTHHPSSRTPTHGSTYVIAVSSLPGGGAHRAWIQKEWAAQHGFGDDVEDEFGDGGVVREVLKHDTVEEVALCDIDEAVVRVSKQFLPHMSSLLTSPKVNVFIKDGFKFLAEKISTYDVIITDSSDPVGRAASLFGEPYFWLLHDALTPGGHLYLI
ncbi:hypothetical protein EW146_g2300 [Bondarzewia mesenterica]|uniref:PABS domain-containing protein n=1 Tax=Bondarzewia mesenterica TaxID=1095465 RepID=A0A4S4M107_9AGAM|nr:hypothetical protein EW146_g2300 [Bondarzewia mesenterica]